MSRRLEWFGIIGAGNIAAELASVLARSLPEPKQQLSALVRKGQMARAEDLFSHFAEKTAVSVAVFEEDAGFIAVGQDLVVEPADYTSVPDYVSGLLEAGIETVIASTGALSDRALPAQLEQAATSGCTRLILIEGNPSPTYLRTSLQTVYSLAREVLRQRLAIVS